MTTAGAEVLAALAHANRDYEAHFGHMYLVCADGRSGEELLRVLHERLGNDAITECCVLRDELTATTSASYNHLPPTGTMMNALRRGHRSAFDASPDGS